jgi:ketosteroid isomerase-like protein
MNIYDRGDLVELKGIFRNDAEVETDPTTITFKIQPDGGVATTYVYGTNAQLVRVSAGVYTVNWIADSDGVHQYRFIGTGAIQQEQGGQFYGRPRNVV